MYHIFNEPPSILSVKEGERECVKKGNNVPTILKIFAILQMSVDSQIINTMEQQ